jgi:hypothetical protein
MPARVCSICQHPNVQQIDSLLDSGTFQKTISEQFHISKFALSRHARRLCQSTDLEPDEKIWLDRLERAHAQAVIDQDVRGMQQTATAGLREIRARKAAKAKAAEVAPDAEDEDKISVGSLDDVMEMFNRVPSSPVDDSKLRGALAKARSLCCPDAVQILHRMLECPEFGRDLVHFAAVWQPAQKEESANESIPETTVRAN